MAKSKKARKGGGQQKPMSLERYVKEKGSALDLYK